MMDIVRRRIDAALADGPMTVDELLIAIGPWIGPMVAIRALPVHVRAKRLGADGSTDAQHIATGRRIVMRGILTSARTSGQIVRDPNGRWRLAGRWLARDPVA